MGISELELLRLSEPFLDACYIRKITHKNTILYIALDCSIPCLDQWKLVSVLWSEHRSTLNFGSDVKIRVRQAVNMILLLVLIPKINLISSVARGQFCSDVSVILDCKLTSCVFFHTSVCCSGVKNRLDNSSTQAIIYFVPCWLLFWNVCKLIVHINVKLKWS